MELEQKLNYARSRVKLFDIADGLGQTKQATQHLLSACTAYEVVIGILLEESKKASK